MSEDAEELVQALPGRGRRRHHVGGLSVRPATAPPPPLDAEEVQKAEEYETEDSDDTDNEETDETAEHKEPEKPLHPNPLLRPYNPGEYPALYYRAFRHLYINRRQARFNLVKGEWKGWTHPENEITGEPLPFAEWPHVVEDPAFKDTVTIEPHEQKHVYGLLVWFLRKQFQNSSMCSRPGYSELFFTEWGDKYLEIFSDCRIICSGQFREQTFAWMCMFSRIMCDPSQVCLPLKTPHSQFFDPLFMSTNRARIQKLVGYKPILRTPQGVPVPGPRSSAGAVGTVQRVRYRIYLNKKQESVSRVTLYCENGFAIRLREHTNDRNFDFVAVLRDAHKKVVPNISVDLLALRLHLTSVLPMPRQLPRLLYRVDLGQRDRAREMYQQTEWLCIGDLRMGIWRPNDMGPKHKGFLILYSPSGTRHMVDEARAYLRRYKIGLKGKYHALIQLLKLAYGSITALLTHPLVSHHKYNYAENAMRTAVDMVPGGFLKPVDDAKAQYGHDTDKGSCVVFDLETKPEHAQRLRTHSLRVVSAVRFVLERARNTYYIAFVGTMHQAVNDKVKWDRTAKISPSCLSVSVAMAMAYHVHGMAYVKLHNMGSTQGHHTYANAASAAGFKSFIAEEHEPYLTLAPLPDTTGNDYYMYFTAHRPDPTLSARLALQDTTNGSNPFRKFYKGMFRPGIKRKLHGEPQLRTEPPPPLAVVDAKLNSDDFFDEHKNHHMVPAVLGHTTVRMRKVEDGYEPVYYSDTDTVSVHLDRKAQAAQRAYKPPIVAEPPPQPQPLLVEDIFYSFVRPGMSAAQSYAMGTTPMAYTNWTQL